MTYLSAAGRMQMDTLFRQHHGWLSTWLRRRSRTIGSPEDIASEVFVRLASSKDLTNLREPRALMTTIAQRVIYELRRRNDLWNVCRVELESRSDAIAPSPEEILMVREALRLVDSALETMTPKARAAFLYCKVDGMKQADIARTLGVSLATVERHIAQGMRRLLAAELGL